MAWIIFNGVDSRDMGVLIEQLPDFHRPKRSVTYTPVSGRDGRLSIDEGTYDVYQATMRINCFGARLKDVYEWLSGTGWLITSLEPDRRVMVDLHMQISDKHYRLASAKCMDSLTVSVYCQPFRYFWPDAAADTITATPYTVNNTGTAPSRPRLTIYGNGDVSVMIGTEYFLQFEGLSGGVIVDCEMQECMSLDETQLLNSIATIDEFPTLKPGRNAVSWTGSVTRIIVEKRCRDL